MQLVRDMHYDHELKGEWIPVYLRHSSAGGEFEALFSVYNQRHDSLGVSYSSTSSYMSCCAFGDGVKLSN
jgi:hypothetical protein